MAPLTLNIELGQGGVTMAIESLKWSTSPMGLATFLQTRAKNWLQKRAKDRFDIEGDDASGEWEELKPSTYHWREEMGFVPVRINHRTGALHNWVVNNPGFTYPAAAVTSMEWPGGTGSGEIAEKYVTAQMGKIRPATVPRPVVAVDEVDLLAILTFLGDFVMSMQAMRTLAGPRA